MIFLLAQALEAVDKKEENIYLMPKGKNYRSKKRNVNSTISKEQKHNFVLNVKQKSSAIPLKINSESSEDETENEIRTDIIEFITKKK